MTTPFLFVPVFSWPTAPGGKLHTYAAGGTTPQGTWSDAAGAVPNTNPVTLDSNGDAVVRLTSGLAYHFVLKDSTDTTTLWDTDNYQASYLTQSDIGTLLYPRTTAEIAASVTPTNYAYEPGNVLRYGADPAGSTDSTAAFTSAGLTGYLIYAPRGTYKVSSGITITGGGIRGDGSYLTNINTTDTGNNNVFLYTGSLAGVFRDFSLNLATTKTGGYGIVVGPASGEVSGVRFLHVVINGLPNHISFTRASLWSVVACNFYGYTGDAIKVDNQNNADSGDSVISSCQFTSPGNTAANSIEQVASGGLKIVGNKFNNAGVHVLLNLGINSTSDLIISGNSFENAHFDAIQLQRQGGSSALFQNVVVTGNQFLVSSASGTSSGVYSNNGASFLSGLTIVGNNFRISDTGGATGILLDYVSDFTVSGNDIIGNAGTSLGIDIGTHNTAGMLGINRVSGCGTNYSIPSGIPNINPISETGWGVPTGNSVVTNFPGASATLGQCSATIAQIITDLKTMGVYLT